ncbi:MAG TPA: hypothetical protein VFJ02_16255 [Vicinamibacterales bacterium]|nr:hypothetical protein [Vicinamibacterales bacterium]
MILYLGSSRDRVYPRFVSELQRSRFPFAIVDEDNAGSFQIARASDRWTIHGPACTGRRPVRSIFVRHAVARTLDPQVVAPMGALQAQLNLMLLDADCPVVNPPSHAFSNYSKVFQLGLLADAGFDVPRTLLTNVSAEALRFVDELNGRVIFKGASNVMSYAQRWKPEHADRVRLLPNSPTQFQEFVEGADYRVHVVGDQAFVTRLAASNEDYRRSALADNDEIVAEPATLPDEVVARCVSVTRALGLVVSGIDFKESADGRLVALELNPFPQFTFYEGRSGQPITRAVVEFLGEHQEDGTTIYA